MSKARLTHRRRSGPCERCGASGLRDAHEPYVDRYVGLIVREMRTRRGLSQEQLAAAIGKSPSQISRLEAGVLTVPLRLLPRLAAALEVPIRDLLPGTWLLKG